LARIIGRVPRRSRMDFIAKMGIVEEECDESLYWMELLIESGAMTPNGCPC